MPKRFLYTLLVLTLLTGSANYVFAQTNWQRSQLDSEANKNPKYDDRQLGSEKSAEKKFNPFRHFVQNTIVHFNYYYDANNRINQIIDEASLSNKDDYTRLLSFYPYTLNGTAAYQKDLDSVIQKCTAAILLHDLRNDWVDNMYLLLGKSYFFKKNLDTAEAVFQFINYNLFPRKKGDDDDRIIGSNSDSVKGTLSIATREHPNILQKIASQPPSRNDALIMLARTFIEEGNYGDAAGLINTLQVDQNLPKRLKDDVEELDAYLFFQQRIYDSAAPHLEKSLSNASTKTDLARREFLLAQLYEMNHDYDKASVYYNKAAQHTVNPLMDIYAQVDNAKMLKSTDPKQLDISIGNLLKMAKKDKFEIYRPILYYSAGQLAMQKPDTTAAVNYYSLALHDSTADVTLMNKSLLALGDIHYSQRDYKKAFAEYDSLGTGDTTLNDRLDAIHAKRNLLEKIVMKERIIDREDSLQQIAAMPEAERNAFVKRLSKKLTKSQDSKDAQEDFGQADGGFITDQSASIFTPSSGSGDWYFYNTAVRAQGANDFKIKWGTRQNVDNWNRKSALDAARASTESPNMNTTPGNDNTSPDSAAKQTIVAPIIQPDDYSYTGLMGGLPLTQQQLAASNKLVYENLYLLAKVFQDEVQDYRQAIEQYERSLVRYPDSLHNGDIYLGLYFCYDKLGNFAKADYYKSLLSATFPGSRAEKAALNPALLNPKIVNAAATAAYKHIYDLFLAGSFDEAMEAKTKADNLYDSNYWSPQLLYIQAVYYIKACNDDSDAIKALQHIVFDFPKSPMMHKASVLINVLSKRTQIETELRYLKVTRAADSETVITARTYLGPTRGAIVEKPVQKDSTHAAPVITPVVTTTALVPINHKDSLSAIPDSFSISTTATYNVIMVLQNVDRSYAGEARNAIGRYNDENYYAGQNYTATYDTLDATHSLVVVASFKNADEAMSYYTKLKKAAPDELSWLTADKYSFLIITNRDLAVLKKNKNIAGYRKALGIQYPGRF